MPGRAGRVLRGCRSWLFRGGRPLGRAGDRLLPGLGFELIYNLSRIFYNNREEKTPPKEESMQLPEYITQEEVQKICRELKISDWTKLKEPRVSPEEAGIILKIVNVEGMNIPLEDFRRGLEVELEHGTMYHDANVTNNHPVLTGKIVLAHLKETMDYYARLEVAELEGDLLAAMRAGDLARAHKKYQALLLARQELAEAEMKQIK